MSKKGRIPTVNGLLLDGQSNSQISLTRLSKFPGSILSQSPLIFELNSEALPEKTGRILIPKFDISTSFPDGMILSRFLGKIALEVLALRFSVHPEGIEYIVDEIQLDDIRNHVRYGKTTDWPCSVRLIYDKNLPLVDDKTGELYQITNEFTILKTEDNEFFLVLAIFGIEFVINIGGAEIAGYKLWLNQNNYKSPLYVSE